MIENKKGNILTENIIFIVLNLVFLSILLLFLFTKMSSAAILEEASAKKIALIIDSAKPGMTIHLNMESVIEKAMEEERSLDEVILIKDNVVTVQVREKGGYSYSFFNDVQVDVNLDTTNNKEYFFVISEK